MNSFLSISKKGYILLGIAIIVITILLYSLNLVRNNSVNTGESNNSIVFWGVNEPASVMNAEIQAYKQLHPNVKITYIQQPADQYENLVLGRLTTPNVQKPDIVMIGNSWLPLIKSDLATSPNYSYQDYKKIFYPTALSDFTINQSIYAIPSEFDGLGVFYNKTMLTAAGISAPSSDIYEFMNQVKSLTKSQSIQQSSTPTIQQAGLAMGTTNNIANSADILSLLMLQNGVTMTDPTFKNAEFNTPNGVEAINFYTQLPTQYNFWNSSLPDSVQAFALGQVAMIYGQIQNVLTIKQINPNLDFDIAPVPQMDSTINYSKYYGYAVTNTSAYQSQAWDFIKYLEEPTVLQDIYNKTQDIYGIGFPYPRQDMAHLLTNSKYEAAYVKMAPTATSWHMGNESVATKALNTAIDSINKAAGTTPTASIVTAAKTVTSELQLLSK